MASADSQPAQKPGKLLMRPPASPDLRRNSGAAIISSTETDELAQTLDQIHSSASQSGTLTTFDDLAPTNPSLATKEENPAVSPAPPATVGNLYDIIKTSVGLQSQNPPKSKSDESRTKPVEDAASDKLSQTIRPETSKSAIEKLRQVSDNDKFKVDGSNDAGISTSPNSSRSLKSLVSVSETHKAGHKPTAPVRDDLQDGTEWKERVARLGGNASKLNATNGKLSSDQNKGKPTPPSSLPDNSTTSPPASRGQQQATATLSTSFRRTDLTDDLDDTEVGLSIPTVRSRSPAPSLQSTRSLNSSLRISGYSVPSAAGTQESRLLTEKGDLIAPQRTDKGSSHKLNAAAQSKQASAPNHLILQMQQKILSRDFWMKDENAKVCFNCGESFSTFRRKHHCRVCGQIYCNSCTNLISGKPFGQASKLRVCRTCEGMLVEDDSSDYSEDDESSVGPASKQIRFTEDAVLGTSPGRSNRDKRGELYKLPNNSGTSVASRRPRELRRALTTVNDPSRQSPLARPPSNRSLKSLAARPRSSSHRSHPFRHQHMRSLNFLSGDTAPFHRNVAGQEKSEQYLPAFHTDSIIDPDLAPFMSDSESSGDDISNISAALADDSNEHNAMGLNGILGALRRGGRPRTPGKTLLEGSPVTKDIENNSSMPNSRTGQTRRQLGGRTFSTGSITNYASSPHIIRSDNLLKRSDSMYSIMDQFQPSKTDLPSNQGHRDTMIDPGSLLESNSGMAELNPASHEHVKNLLRQFISDSAIEHSKRWERALLPILLQCAEQVVPSIHRGDDIDIRHYVKLKKAPGGSPNDSKYISGIVFTNNVALRDMPRSIQNPRILLVSFPLVYARHEEHFMSLEGVIAQEREYLRNLSKRIIALRPNLMLVQGQVSGLLTGFLRDAGVTVVQNVKSSAILAASRCTQTRVVSSVDKLTMDPSNLGRCGRFDIKTNVYNNAKKSHVYLSGCQKDLGCTVVLRGAGQKVLSKLKWITEFMCYVVYNLKLETCLLRDQFISLPSTTEATVQDPSFSSSTTTTLEHGGGSDSVPGLDAKKEIPPGGVGPYDTTVRELKKRILSASPFVTLPAPYLLLRGQEQECKMSQLKSLQQSKSNAIPEDDCDRKESATQKFELVHPNMVYATTENSSPHVRDILQAIHKSEYEKAAHNYTEIKRRWEMYINGVSEPYSPVTHQKIVTLFSIVSMPSSDACVGPDLLGLDFYQEHDIDEGCERDMPLGEYIERLCDQENQPCMAGNCEQNMIDHQRQYVHGDGQVTVSIRKSSSRYKGMENTILMWSVCRICEQETQVTRMSPDSWKYSFAKYLELSFWTLSLKPRAGTCSHNIHRDHIRYFGFKNLAVLVQYDPIKLVEVRVPRGTITWAVDKDLHLKNEQFQRIEDRMLRFLSSVKLRLKKIKLDSIEPDKYEECKSEVESLVKRVGEQQEELIQKLQEKYMDSKFFEIVPLNRAVRFLQEKVAEWDTIFADLESNYFPSEKDLRKLAAIQLRNAIMDRESPLPINIGEDGNLIEKMEGYTDGQNVDQKTKSTQDQDSQNESPNDPKNVIEDIHAPTTSNPERSPVVQHLDLALPASNDERNPAESKIEPQSELERTIISPTERPDAAQEESTNIAPDHTADFQSREEQTPSKELNTSHKTKRVPPPLTRSKTQPATPKSSKADAVRAEDSPMTKKSIRTETDASTPTLPASKIPLAIPGKSSDVKSPTGSGSAALRIGKTAMHSMIPRVVGGKRLDSRVSILAKHFEELSREFERERIRERRQRAARTRQSRAFPLASVKPIVEVFRDANEAVRERELTYEANNHLEHTGLDVDRHQDSETGAADDTAKAAVNENDTTGEQSEENTVVASYPPSEYEATLSEADTVGLAEGALSDIKDRLDLASMDSQDQTLDIGKQEKTSLMKMLTSFWSERSASGWVPLEYPLPATDHIFVDSDLIVREDEPSSLIAFALDSQDYKGKIQKFWERANAADQAQSSPISSTGSTDMDVERIMLGKTATHMRYQCQSGSARMQCKIFYAESFDAIRRKCGISDRFVESLSRCLKWDSKGGKTKSLFLKTLDERFVLKSISPVETQAFLKFAPDYFEYMSKCLFHRLPSALAKMLGFYQVVIRNPITGTEFNLFLQVMENVFYEGPSNRMFDLKGSMRNRKVQSTGELNEVLLDENLLDYISQSPVYVRNHSNTILASSIQNDTLFCSKQNVMDYSLIVGLYEEKKELLVGIIDYIRTYTWDKKLESWIKDRGKHKATVRSPKEYRTRFRRSIPRYFPLAPSCWQVFGMQRIEEARARLEYDLEEVDFDESDGKPSVEDEEQV